MDIRLPLEAVARLRPRLRRRHSAIAFTPDGSAVFTGGQDTTLKRWSLERSSAAVTGITVGPDPKVRFEPADATLLWVGDARGTLALCDSRDGTRRHGVSAHAGGVTGLDCAAGSGLVATCGADHTIRFWRRARDRIVAVGKPIRHEEGLRSLALSPDGTRVAAYDARDRVALWDVASGRRLGQAVMQEDRQADTVAGLVAFNADGSLVAAAGPGQSFWLLSGAALAPLESLPMVSGRGGTAIAWHPLAARRVVAGDTLGRIYGYPERQRPFFGTSIFNEGVVGLAFSPNGRRLASAHADGSVHVFDHAGIGLVLSLQGDHPEPTDLRFDPAGRRLALVHRDGRIVLWESRPRDAGPAAVQTQRRWAETVLLRDRQARTLFLRSQAAALDERDRLHLLYSRGMPDPADPRRPVVLGRQADDGWRAEVLDLDGVNPRSLALLVGKTEVFATVRQPVESYAGQLLLVRRRVDPLDPARGPASGPEPLFEKPANWGFDTHLLPEPSGRPTALHYSHERHELLVTRWDGGRWRTDPVGRQGDGLYVAAARSPDGRLHAVFRPDRFNGDVSPLTYLAVGDGGETRREVVDLSFDAGGQQMTIAPDGSPVVLYGCRGDDGAWALVVARRSASGWMKEVSLEVAPALRSNPIFDDRGTARFAYTDPGRRRILLASGTGGRWQTELIWEDGGADDVLDDEQWEVQVVALVDRRGRPVIVAARHSEEDGWLRVFRLAE